MCPPAEEPQVLARHPDFEAIHPSLLWLEAWQYRKTAVSCLICIGMEIFVFVFVMDATMQTWSCY